MLAYICENCGQFTLLGYENSYEEHFCSIDCYEKYCKNHGYEFQAEHIKKTKNTLND